MNKMEFPRIPVDDFLPPPIVADFRPPITHAPSSAAPAFEMAPSVAMDYHQYILEQSRPKKSAEVEPLLGAPRAPQTSSQIYQPGTAVSFESPVPIGAEFFTSSVVAQHNQQQQPKLAVTPPPRPDAPSPSVRAPVAPAVLVGHAGLEAPTFSESILATSAPSSSAEVIQKSVNLLDNVNEASWEFIQKHALSGNSGASGAKWANGAAGVVDWKPAGKRIRDNIIAAWRQHFFSPDTEQVEFAPIQTAARKTPLCQCQSCHCVIDVVEYIRHLTKGEVYDGSSLDQLERKLKVLNAKCPSCQSEELSDPVNGHGEIPILLEGTLIGSTGEDGEHLEDPTLYKVAPKSTNHMELRDPMEELRQQQTSNSVTEVTDVTDDVTPPVADKGKEEESEAEKPQKDEMTPPAAEAEPAVAPAETPVKFFLSSSIVPALIREGGGRLAQVASVWKGQFGQFGKNFQGLDSVRYAKNQVELALVDENRPSTEKLKVFTVADQYIKKARPSQVAVNALAVECVQFLMENFGGDYVLRECLPCEHQIAGKQWSILAKGNFYVGAVGVVNQVAWCSFSLELLFIHYVVSVIRQDVTRPHVWMDGKFAPWEVIVVGDNDEVTKRYLSMLQQAGFTCRACPVAQGGVVDKAIFADELGALALITIEPGETSVYSTKCVVRNRDQQGEKKCTYLEVVPTLMEIKSRCN